MALLLLVIPGLIGWPLTHFLAAPVDHKSSFLVPGSWIARNGSIIGKGRDEVVTFAKDRSGWTMQITSVYNSGVNSKDTPTRSIAGPFRIDIRNGVIRSKDHCKAVEYTFLLNEGILTFPALIQVNDRTWKFAYPPYFHECRCDSNPKEMPVGKAEVSSGAFTGVKSYPAYYIYEDGPYVPPPKIRAKYLRFMTRLPDGTVREVFRLIWDEYGSPRYDGDNHLNLYERRHLLMSEAEIEAINRLPIREPIRPMGSR
jgi:hypothetical protein